LTSTSSSSIIAPVFTERNTILKNYKLLVGIILAIVSFFVCRKAGFPEYALGALMASGVGTFAGFRRRIRSLALTAAIAPSICALLFGLKVAMVTFVPFGASAILAFIIGSIAENENAFFA
jgi:hypothetical protein